jgi:cytochrome c oxidase subunit 4
MADHDKQDEADAEKPEPAAKESSAELAGNGDAAASDADGAAPASASPTHGVKPAHGVAPAQGVPHAVAVAHGVAPAHGDAAGHADHGLAHTTPISLLFGILAALMVLTVLTVSVTSFDLGAQGNLVVAMVIATIKAGLVVAFFMHLVWDKKLHLILFLTSVLFLILFLSLSVNDRGEYQPDIDSFQSSATSK